MTSESGNPYQNQNYYEILGVERSATEEEITKAFEEMIMKFHPKRNHNRGAPEMYQKIWAAFRVLMNPTLKADYDYRLEDYLTETEVDTDNDSNDSNGSYPTEYDSISTYSDSDDDESTSPWFDHTRERPYYTNEEELDSFFNFVLSAMLMIVVAFMLMLYMVYVIKRRESGENLGSE